MGVLSTGITGLNAFRTQLATTAHNVANVNTEGYNRQVVDLSTLPATLEGTGYIGNGVQIAEIRRQFDQFLMDRVRVHTASNEDYQSYLDRASRIDDLIADPDAGLSGALQSFFNAVQDVADDPASTTTRDVLLSNSNILVDRFHSMHQFLEGMRLEINQDLKTLVGEANSITGSIAQLNNEIQLAVNGTGSTPNDLLDRRDVLITKLSELVSVTTVAQDNGAINVFLGNGQAIVIGARAFTLGTAINDAEPDRVEITIESGGNNVQEISDFLTGGKFGGYLRFRENILDPTENALGRLAMGLGTFFNDQHKLGMDLNGELGKDFFTVPNEIDQGTYWDQMLLEVQGTATLVSVDEAELTTSDYELRTNDGVTWTLYDRYLKTTTPVTPNAAGDITFGGVTVNVGLPASWSAGDNFIIRPTRLAARALEVEITDAREVAAASPIGISKGLNAISGDPNTGAARVSNSGLSFREAPPGGFTLLGAAGVTLTYDATPGSEQFDISTGGSIAYDPATDSGKQFDVTIPGLGVFSFNMTGTPDDGDTFVLSTNSNNVSITDPIAIGDNRNALKLAQLQTDKTMRNNSAGEPTSSFVSLYASVIGEVGSKTRQAMISNETQARLKEQSITALDEVSGVNLDEEAANLVHFQQAYQAATQVIRVSNTLFDSLLNAF